MTQRPRCPLWRMLPHQTYRNRSEYCLTRNNASDTQTLVTLRAHEHLSLESCPVTLESSCYLLTWVTGRLPPPGVPHLAMESGFLPPPPLSGRLETSTRWLLHRLFSRRLLSPSRLPTSAVPVVTPGSRRQSRRDRDRRNDEDEQLDTAALFAIAPHVQALIEDKGLVHIQGNSSVVSHRRDVGISNRRFLFSILLRALLYFAWYIPHAL